MHTDKGSLKFLDIKDKTFLAHSKLSGTVKFYLGRVKQQNSRQHNNAIPGNANSPWQNLLNFSQHAKKQRRTETSRAPGDIHSKMNLQNSVNLWKIDIPAYRVMVFCDDGPAI